MKLADKIKRKIRDIQDFPQKGIVFRDITPVLKDSALCHKILCGLADPYKDRKPDAVIGIESRGFLFGMGLAQHFGIPFIPVRKQGKLPHKTHQHAYTLEYGEAVLEMHQDALHPGSNVIIHDDLLATGGTCMAAESLVRQAGAIACGFSFIIELDFLKGRRLLENQAEVHALVHY